MASLGRWLDTTRKRHARVWRRVFFVLLAILLAANIAVRPHHSEYGYDAYPGFWAVFGLVVAVGMVVVMKKLVYPLINGPEDPPDDD
jgi:predicted Co/Zn/Cd cation transporter (cation efflux family)